MQAAADGGQIMKAEAALAIREAYASLPDPEAHLGKLEGRAFEVIKDKRGMLAPTTKKVLIALTVLAIAAVVFTGIGAAGIGVIGVAFAAIKASAVLSVALAAAAVVIGAISQEIIDRSQKEYIKTLIDEAKKPNDSTLAATASFFETEMMPLYQELCGKEKAFQETAMRSSQELAADPGNGAAKATATKCAKELQEILKRKELIFAERLSRNPEAQLAFETLRTLFPQDFAIPVDQRMALLSVVKIKSSAFDGVNAVEKYLKAAAAAKAQIGLEGGTPHGLAVHFQETLLSKVVSADDHEEIVRPLSEFSTLMSLAMGEGANTQLFTDDIMKSVEAEAEGALINDTTRERAETNVHYFQSAKEGSSKVEQELLEQHYRPWPGLGIWSLNSWEWTREGDGGSGPSVIWKGHFALNQTGGKVAKFEKSATLDLQALGPLQPSQKIKVMEFVKIWSAGDQKRHKEYQDALTLAESGIAAPHFLSVCKWLLPQFSEHMAKIQEDGDLAIIPEQRNEMVAAYKALIETTGAFSSQVNRHMLTLYTSSDTHE